jgi:uncharacterized protein YndB with AHSA1/START domain
MISSPPVASNADLSLVARRVIAATPEFLFNAWTRPDQLMMWWGPKSVRCSHAEVDQRVGGRFRIGNTFPNGSIVWIIGEFEVFEPPRKLVYSWRIDSSAAPAERVTVRFEPCAEGTEVIVVHDKITDMTVRAAHEQGWQGCLEGLAAFARQA